MDKKTSSVDPLEKPGFRLLKAGKKLCIAGKNFIRLKDVEIKKGDKKHVEKNIKKISYVPHSLIKSLGISPGDFDKFLARHFEPEVFEKIPAIAKENLKKANARIQGKLDNQDQKKLK